MDTEREAPERAEDDEPRHPGALELLPILPIVALVAWSVRSYELYPWVSTGAAVGIAVASAALLGLPALFWALDHGYGGLVPLTLLGAIAGVLPLGLVVCSAVAGLMVRVGIERALDVLQRGAPIPGMGTMPWVTFARVEIPAAAIGAISAVVYWVISRAIARVGVKRTQGVR